MQYNTSLPDLRLPEPPQSLKRKQHQRNMVNMNVNTRWVRVLTWHDQSSIPLRLDICLGPCNAVGTKVPAKPSKRMHTELDPRPEGGTRGGIQHMGRCTECVTASDKTSHQVLYYPPVSLCALVRDFLRGADILILHRMLNISHFWVYLFVL